MGLILDYKAVGRQGRPPKFNEKMQENLLFWAAQDGYTDKKICSQVGITVQTLTNWKKKHPEFFASFKDAKDVLNRKVAKSVYARARGYRVKKTVLAQHKGVFVDEHEIVEHHPPDMRAAELWLHNRDPNRWRNKQVTEIENAGDILRAVVKMFGEN